MSSTNAKHAEGHHSIIASLLQVQKAVAANMGDGFSTMFRSVLQDKAFAAFLGASVLGFTATTASEYLRVKAILMNKKHHKTVEQKQASANESSSSGGKKKKKQAKVGKGFYKNLWFLLKIALPSPWCRGVRLLLTQFFLLVMRTLVSVRTSKLSVYFLTRAISQGSWKYWVRWLCAFAGWLVCGVATNTGLKFTEAQIELELRTRLTKHIHKLYLKNNAFYRATLPGEAADGRRLDNADQRIVVDVSQFSHYTAFLYGHSFTPILNFALSLMEASKDLGYSRPIALFFVNSIMNVALRSFAPSLGSMVAKEQALEGEFRRAHARLIAHAEEVAFLQGSEAEQRILDDRLSELSNAIGWHSLVKIRKDMLDQFFKFQSLMVGGVFVHIPFLMSPSLSDAERISAFRATEELMLRCGGAYSEILLLGRQIDELAGYTHRIMELFHALEAPTTDKHTTTNTTTNVLLATQSGDSVEKEMIDFDKVSVYAPEPNGSKRLLVKQLDMKVVEGKSVLITGPNGCGKTSLFRVVAGLWHASEGNVRCALTHMMWLPQRPYLVIGTLRDQVAYPQMLGFNTTHDSRIMACLEMAGITKLASAGLDRMHEEWDEVLSGGERQRLGFARLYFHKPKFAVLDEATSAINPDEEMMLYKKVLETGTTVFSIAHRLELRALHHVELKIHGDGSGKWDLIQLQ